MNTKKSRFQLVLFALVSVCANGAFAAAPTLSGFSPASGILSSTVTLTGTNFVAPMTVSFGGVNSTIVTVVSSTVATATVPTTAATGTITVITSGGSVASTSAYTVLPGVGITPSAVGPPTSSVTLYYSGFSAREPIDLYFDTGDIALSAASASGAGNIAVSIPASAHPGSHWISAVGRRSINAAQLAFTVRASWPQVGFVPNHRGKNRYENVLSVASVVDLDQAWQTTLGANVETTPAVVNGIVYASFDDGVIRAFDETTGALKWSYVAGTVNEFSSPAVSNGIVYTGSSNEYLYALDAVTGALKWRYLTGGAVDSSPNVVNGIVYFGSLDGNVYALNATTGALIWSFGTTGSVFASPMIANGVVYVGSYDTNLYALNATTGAKIWSYATGGLISGSAVFAGGFVCVGSGNGNMYGLYAATGSVAWTFSTGGPAVASSPAAVGGALFFGDNSGKVYSLSSDGVVLWTTTLPGTGGIVSPVCVANGVVYATNSYYTDALDQSTGALLTALPGGSTDGGPVAVNGAVFVGDDNVGGVIRFTPNALLSSYAAPRPDPMQLRPHHLK